MSSCCSLARTAYKTDPHNVSTSLTIFVAFFYISSAYVIFLFSSLGLPIGFVATFFARFRCPVRALRDVSLLPFPSSRCSFYVSPQRLLWYILFNLQFYLLDIFHLFFSIVIQTYTAFCIHFTTNSDFSSTASYP